MLNSGLESESELIDFRGKTRTPPSPRCPTPWTCYWFFMFVWPKQTDPRVYCQRPEVSGCFWKSFPTTLSAGYTTGQKKTLETFPLRESELTETIAFSCVCWIFVFFFKLIFWLIITVLFDEENDWINAQQWKVFWEKKKSWKFPGYYPITVHFSPLLQGDHLKKKKKKSLTLRPHVVSNLFLVQF